VVAKLIGVGGRETAKGQRPTPSTLKIVRGNPGGRPLNADEPSSPLTETHAAGVIVVGHSRLLAAPKLDLREVPVHVAADLTEAQCRAYRIADNRAGEEARWDDKLLKLGLN